MTTASPSRTRAKTTARRPAAARPVRQLDEVQVVDLRTDAAAEREPDLVEIFRIDGRPYAMDRNQDAGVVLRYLKLVRSKGENVALSYLFEEVMGQEAYEALTEFKGITPAQLGQVMLAVQTVLLGSGNMVPKARSSRG